MFFLAKFLIRAVKARALMKQSCRTILNKAVYGLDKVWFSEEPHRLAWHQSSSGSMPPEDANDGSISQTNQQ